MDSNNHQPFFSKPKYVYNLISTYEEDFKRQLELNPIVATDYDVTNGELVFDVQGNEYFKVLYGGVVPGTLNKKHFAQLVPKFPGKIITKKVEVIMTVTVSIVFLTRTTWIHCYFFVKGYRKSTQEQHFKSSNKSSISTNTCV